MYRCFSLEKLRDATTLFGLLYKGMINFRETFKYKQ